MAENADNESLSPSRAARRAPSKRRASSVSSDTENKLARAAQSAQRLAQLSEPPRDESTLDLFAGDPAHAPVPATQTDRHQGTLTGFERPEQVRLAAGAAQITETTESVEAGVAASHNHARAEGAAAAAAAAGIVMSDAAPRGTEDEGVAAPEPVATVPADSIADSEAAAEAVVPVTDVAQTPVVDEVNGGAAEAALPESAATRMQEAATEPMLPGQALAQLHARRSAAAQRPVKGGRAVLRAMAADAAAAGDASCAVPGERSGPASMPRTETSPASDRAAPQSRDAADIARAAGAVESGDATARQTPPELDHVRAAAFADTVDALYGVIASQRRAAADQSRRMKWMLGAVVGALLVTVAAGVAQTIALSRLATGVSAQQRIVQMMQDQQAAIAGVLATLPSQAGASAGRAVSESAARAAGTTPAHPAQRAAAHGHRARPAGQ